MISRALTFSILPFLLAACGADPAPAAKEADPVPPTTSELIERHQDVQLLLNANGLGPRIGAPVRFGAPREKIDFILENTLGVVPEKSRNADCGAGPMDFSEAGPIQVAYQDGKFVGWYLREGDRVVTTDGVGAGIPLASLKAERQMRIITDSTLEGEFEYQTADGGVITGFFKGDQNDGTIVALQAGLNCFFR